MKAPVLPLRRHGRIAPAVGGDVLLSVSIGPAGEAVALWSAPADREALTSVTVQPGWASFPDSRAAQPAAARITVHSPEPSALVPIAALPIAHATVQPLPDGRFLLVGARCRWRPDGPDRNAIVYGPDGTALAEHTFGDGIQNVFTTASGDAWVGYFDEGVYGNYGWGGSGAQPMGDCGLIRFGADGQPQWRFPADDAPFIDDCYALNVVGETAWACYYSDFPVVRIEGDRVDVWDNGLAAGATSLIVGAGTVGLAGGYSPHRDRLVVGELGDGRLGDGREFRLVLPDGDALPDQVWMIGRGPDLHVVHGGDWYRVGLDDVRP